jgi:hypothetical protein
MTKLPLFVLAVILLGSALIFGYSRHQANESMARNRTALVALCALRYDLDLRIATSQTFLDEHPKGIPGVPVALIQTGLANSIRTRKTLDVLECPPVPTEPQFP